MKRLFCLLALSLGQAGAAPAQTGVRITPMLGAFEPMLPMVAVADGRNPDVELRHAPVVGLELGVAPRQAPWMHAYASLAYTSPRLGVSPAMQSNPANGRSVRTDLLIPTAGIVLSPSTGRLAVRPTLRLGVGVKSYDFDLVERRDRVTDLTGDLGIGVAAGRAPVVFTAEARWLPSRFDARNLPIAVLGRHQQDQNDWIFQMGMRMVP